MSNNNDQEIARNIFLNLDQKELEYDFGSTSFYLSKKGWHTNTQSWIDANVVNSLKGKIISKKDGIEDILFMNNNAIAYVKFSRSKLDKKIFDDLTYLGDVDG